jgi:hypothetical protein
MLIKKALSPAFFLIVSLVSIGLYAAEEAPPQVLAGYRLVDRNITYDEGGKTLIVKPSCQFIINDGCSLLIKDATLKNVGNETFHFLGSESTLILHNATLEFIEDIEWKNGTLIIQKTSTFRSGLEDLILFTFFFSHFEESKGQRLKPVNVGLDFKKYVPDRTSASFDGVVLIDVQTGGKIRIGGLPVTMPSSEREPRKPASPMPPVQPLQTVPGDLAVSKSDNAAVIGAHVTGDLYVGAGQHSMATLNRLRYERKPAEAHRITSAVAAPVALEEFLETRHSDPETLVNQIFERGAYIQGYVPEKSADIEYKIPAGTNQELIRIILQLS